MPSPSSVAKGVSSVFAFFLPLEVVPPLEALSRSLNMVKTVDNESAYDRGLCGKPPYLWMANSCGPKMPKRTVSAVAIRAVGAAMFRLVESGSSQQAISQAKNITTQDSEVAIKLRLSGWL